ncbi:flagellar hook-length control protein FliK [Grimontia sp. NTOU-MAR1]|uniref:flagellar hook-length control protein FliK n=1 Tax=Grimontia sp. NTOU-MAR1 TaxID=3111011 RepID=UPI002DBF18F5|nr:flagellar hook-length control protein FliK [Grimontia sp. NTOU-MAR1]WRV97467.1 flagellar hook-length control protein FliK [Grimontia sp. NTOU-MAR1]
MKIDNINHINTLTQETLKNVPVKSLLEAGKPLQSSGNTGSLSDGQRSQLSQLLALMPLYSLLQTTKSDAKTLAPVVIDLLKRLTMPSDSKQAAKWLAEKQADKGLLEALRHATTATSEQDGAGKLKSLLMLMAEQRINEQTKPGDYHWLFPFRDNNLSPVRINVEKKTGRKKKKLRWCVTLNLTLDKNRHLTATAELEDNSLSLSFSTDADGLKNQIETAMPKLEEKLAQHHIALEQCDISTIESVQTETISSGVNIQV